jgi:hypothetical protein
MKFENTEDYHKSLFVRGDSKKLDHQQRKIYLNKGILKDAIEFNLVNDDLYRSVFSFSLITNSVGRIFYRSSLFLLFCIYFFVYSILHLTALVFKKRTVFISKIFRSYSKNKFDSGKSLIHIS